MLAQIDRRFTKLSLKKSYTRFLSYVFYEGRPLTTKGRWINPLVFTLYRLQTILPLSKQVVKPIFILGTGRSGTTILGITLAMHNDVGFLNEPKALWSYLYNKEDLIGSYQKIEGRYRLSTEDITPLMIRRAHRIFGNYLRFSASFRLVDKYPELIFRYDFVKSIFPDAKFLFLYRNGYDTCHSICRWSKQFGKIVQQQETHDWWGRNDRKWRLLCKQIVTDDEILGSYINEIKDITKDEYRAAVEWIVTMKEGLSLMDRNDNNIMGVQYEGYVGTSGNRQQVLRFCELPPDTRFERFSELVLRAPISRPKFELPPVIEDEFKRVMMQLGYE